MKPSLHRPGYVAWMAPAIVMGLGGCGKATPGDSSGAKADAAQAFVDGGGGANDVPAAAGGASGGRFGSGGGAGSGGAGSGGAGSGGAGSGGAGRCGSPGSGGSSNGMGGGIGDGGPMGSPRDASPDVQMLPGDARMGDAGPAPSVGDGGINVPDGYKLVWSDEFNTDGTPDPKNWNYEKGFVRNNELQWYQSTNASVKGGVLIIEGRKEQVANPNYVAGSTDWKTSRPSAQYTSSSMTTSGLQTWQYGRFEMRARIPTSAGMWPAWWTLGVSGEWPSNGEIDIMEFYKGNVLANVACGTATRWTAKWDSSSKAISSLGASWASSFHVWRMDWDVQNINLYLDDTLLNGVALSNMLNSDGSSPFKQEVYMILNLAIGGDNGGDPSGTPFPVQYQVDYVRVFQKL